MPTNNVNEPLPALTLYVYRANFVSLYDGDTLRFDIDLGFGVWLRNQTIRLYGIDTPELRGKTYGEAAAAKEFARRFCERAIPPRIMSHKDEKGKYGRWLADVYDHKGRSLSQELLRNNHAVRWEG